MCTNWPGPSLPAVLSVEIENVGDWITGCANNVQIFETLVKHEVHRIQWNR